MGGAAALLWSSAAFAAEATTAAEPAAVETAAEEPPPPPPPPTVTEAITHGKPILEARMRYEGVDQTGLAKKAEAFTLRTRFGWETGDWKGLKGLIEFEDVRQLGGERYNIALPGVAGGSLNGKTQYPIVNDPEVTELNRAQLTWVVNAGLTVVAGRQRMLVEDQRFVGNVGWRQDEQTFDAVRADFARGRFKATYAYLGHINRVLGEARDWDSDSHLGFATYAFSDQLRLQGFAMLLDFSNAPANSNQTYGVKASGKSLIGLFQVAYNGTWATQSGYRSNAPAFDLDYWGGDVATTFDIWTVKAGYESLQGNGTRGFITPLATTHAFQGWADAFAAVSGNKTAVDGIRDMNLQLTIRPRQRLTYLFNAELTVRYHDFNAQRVNAALGHEWDLQATAAITPNLSGLIKFARFERASSVPVGLAAPPASRTKFWFSLEYRL